VLSHQRHRIGGSGQLSEVERDPDGTLRLRGAPLGEHAPTLLALLDDAARRAPERAFLIERDPRGVWHQASYATVANRSHRVGAALRGLGASAGRPVMILSGNGIDHALVTFGALRAGIPVVPVAASAGLSARDGFARLRAIAGNVRPGVVFARNGAQYAAAASAAAPEAAYVTVTEPPHGVRASDYAQLLAHAPPAEPEVAVGAQTVAKIMLVPGAGGELKAVVTTHGMLCAMLQGIAQVWPFLDQHPPVVVDWLPWSRALGGNMVLGIVLRHAGTLYVGDGDPPPERFERTALLRAEIPPTIAFDVPLGWAAWVERLRGDDALRRHWLSRLDLACWYGATLAPATGDALRAISVPLAAGWGATETAAAVTLTGGVDARYDAIGAPLGGVELKLVPNGDAYEARVRGPQVTNGYWWRPDLAAAAFDEEGFYRTGDLVRPIDVRAPQHGLAFAARTDERFKLSSGAWVRAAALRERILTECSDVADVLLSGEGRDEIGLLAWPTAAGALLDRDLLRTQVIGAMRRAKIGRGSSERARRALLLAREPALHERAALVTRLHASEPDADVIVVS
jgi:feruloyl-CoA synthase